MARRSKNPQIMKDILTVVVPDTPGNIISKLKWEGWDCVPDQLPARMTIDKARQGMVDMTLAGDLDWPEPNTYAYYTLRNAIEEE